MIIYLRVKWSFRWEMSGILSREWRIARQRYPVDPGLCLWIINSDRSSYLQVSQARMTSSAKLNTSAQQLELEHWRLEGKCWTEHVWRHLMTLSCSVWSKRHLQKDPQLWRLKEMTNSAKNYLTPCFGNGYYCCYMANIFLHSKNCVLPKMPYKKNIYFSLCQASNFATANVKWLRSLGFPYSNDTFRKLRLVNTK